MKPHLLFLKSRCFYLERQMYFYAKDLHFRNTYLLWLVYIRCYFVYCSDLLKTQTATLRKAFKTLYQGSFKRYHRLPPSTPTYALKILLEDFDDLCSRFSVKLQARIQNRY